MLALARNIPQHPATMREGLRCGENEDGGREVYDETLGIIWVLRLRHSRGQPGAGLKMRIVGVS